MKICFLTHSIFDLGGIQRVTSVIASKLSENHRVDILCTTNQFNINRKLYNLNDNVNIIIDDEILNNKIGFRLKSKLIRGINKFGGILNNKIGKGILLEAYYPEEVCIKFIEFLNSNEYDVVIGVAGNFSLLLGTISERVSCKTIGWQHNSFDAYFRNKGKYFWKKDELFKELIPKLDEYVVLTDYDKRMLKSELNIESKVIHNPRSFNSNTKSKLNNRKFLAAGRFNYQKGFDLLIKSFYLFSKVNTDWNLILVGDGEEKDNINKLIREYKIEDRIEIHSFTNDIKKYFLEAAALLLPSRWEGMPMIVLESLEMGVPVITYDIPAIRPLISDGKEGIIIENNNVEQFADAMNRMANCEYERMNMGRLCTIKSNQFSINSIIREWNEIIDTEK